MKNVSVSVGQYERQCLTWDHLVKDFTDHAKYQLVQQVRYISII